MVKQKKCKWTEQEVSWVKKLYNKLGKWMKSLTSIQMADQKLWKLVLSG